MYSGEAKVCVRVSVFRACGLVLELEVCRVRFARVSCPRLRWGSNRILVAKKT